MKKLHNIILIIGILFMVAAAGLLYLTIWTDADGEKLFWTAFLTGVIGIITILEAQFMKGNQI